MATFKKDPKKPTLKKPKAPAKLPMIEKKIPKLVKKVYKTKVGPVKKTKK